MARFAARASEVHGPPYVVIEPGDTAASIFFEAGRLLLDIGGTVDVRVETVEVVSMVKGDAITQRHIRYETMNLRRLAEHLETTSR